MTTPDTNEDEYYTAADLRAACERVIAALQSGGRIAYPQMRPKIGYDQSIWNPYESPCGTVCCLHGHVRLHRPLAGRAGDRMPLALDYADAHVAARAALFCTDVTPQTVMALLDLPVSATQDDVVAVLLEQDIAEEDDLFVTLMDVTESLQRRT